MNDYWHIPRASLSPSSASSAVSSASSTQRSNRSHTKQKLTPTHYRHQQQQQQRHNNNMAILEAGGAGGVAGSSGGRRDSELSATTSAAVTAAAAAAVLAAAKRGSRSSQGSNDSNNSTRSAASGSLLLTAANLERMAEIHKKEHHHQQQQNNLSTNRDLVTASSTYNANLVQVSRDYQLAATTQTLATIAGIKQQQLHQLQHHDQQNATDAVINIDPNLNFIKTKDLDTVSIASSMHFTMVNGEAGRKKVKKGLCDRGRQVTVLIITMSTVFLLLIIGMVYALEMRAREMPQS